MSDNDEAECKRIISKDNYYEILGLEKNATNEQIKKAYRKLAIKFHPDKNKAKSAEEAFKKVNQAFSVLSDENKRKNYDMFGREDLSGGGGNFTNVDPFDVFNMFFGGGFGPMGNMGRGKTTIRFSNGNGTFTTFTSNGFGGGFGSFEDLFNGGNNGDEEGEEFDPFSELFGINRQRRRNTNSNSNTNRGSNNSRNNNRNENRRRREDEIRRQMRYVNICMNVFPLICCLMVFFVLPALSKL